MRIIDELRSAVPQTEDWINEVARRLGWHDRERVALVLLGTLHALRDSLSHNEAVYVGAQLPALLRGLYYDGWHPSAHPAAADRGAFLQRVHDSVHRDPGIDAEQAARTVLATLAARLTAVELENAKAATPRPLHNLWPA
jgi:uncharacterized protein (DUF2267 family)